MENCPECNQRSLVYDPRTKCARCFHEGCGYREEMSYGEYSKRFELEDKNVVHKLYLSKDERIAVT